jgi:hypothetical protein
LTTPGTVALASFDCPISNNRRFPIGKSAHTNRADDRQCAPQQEPVDQARRCTPDERAFTKSNRNVANNLTGGVAKHAVPESIIIRGDTGAKTLRNVSDHLVLNFPDHYEIRDDGEDPNWPARQRKSS